MSFDENAIMTEWKKSSGDDSTR